MIGRGTTPTIRFNLSVINPSEIVSAVMTIAQFGTNVVEKEFDTATVGESYIEWNLSQSETLSIKQPGEAEVQARYRTLDGQAYESKIYKVSVERILHEGVI